MVFVHKRIDGSWPLGNALETKAIAFIGENSGDLQEKTAHPSRFVLLAEPSFSIRTPLTTPSMLSIFAFVPKTSTFTTIFPSL